LEPKVSIVTPLYNSSACIQSTLDSVLGQTFENWELLLVNDGSTDDTAEKIQPYLADSRISYTSQSNQGIAGARNAGIAAATGDWVCLLDHDDRWLPQKLEKQLSFAAEHDLEIVGTDAVVIKGDERSLYSRNFPEEMVSALSRSLDDRSVDVFAVLISGNFLCSSSVAIKRRLFDRLGLLDAQAAPADDYEMWLRCAAAQTRIGYLDERLIEYYLHQDNYSRDTLMMMTKEIYALRKSRALVNKRIQIELLDQRVGSLRARAARLALDTYHEIAGQHLGPALPFFWRALCLAPAEVLRPRRFLAAARRAIWAGEKDGPGQRPKGLG
jgi:glycosyltransferase involved in cell wall biosynthesis